VFPHKAEPPLPSKWRLTLFNHQRLQSRQVAATEKAAIRFQATDVPHWARRVFLSVGIALALINRFFHRGRKLPQIGELVAGIVLRAGLPSTGTRMTRD